MKTGRNFNEFDAINPTYITLVALDCILKRVSLQDMILYLMHNDLKASPEMFCHSVCFNLFSKYGVGKELEPIIRDSFQNSEEMYQKYSNDPFYKEVSKLAPEIVNVERSEKSLYEWSYQYTTKSLGDRDAISLNRFIRLSPLIDIGEDSFENSEGEEDGESEGENREPFYTLDTIITDDIDDECQCLFCVEFRKFCYPKTESVEEIIRDVIENLSK